MGIIYITHRMQEIFSICNSITVLRDGAMVGHYQTADIDEGKVISLMVGRELDNIFDRETTPHGQVVLKVDGLERKGVFHDVSFTVRAGEVLGFSGLMGAGRTEIARCIFGLDRLDAGTIWIDGKKTEIRCVSDAIRAGIAYVPEDRKRDGFIPFMSIRDNIAIPSYLERLSRHGIVLEEEEREWLKKETRVE